MICMFGNNQQDVSKQIKGLKKTIFNLLQLEAGNLSLEIHMLKGF